ncbi:MAG: hypothetical protein KDK70_06900 [Myxococcales bacterium]|nr:hypothetical protein [Myxococcales bacterium]
MPPTLVIRASTNALAGGPDLIYVMGMPQVQVSRSGNVTQYTLDERPLSNGVEVELRLGGNRGWIPVTITGLPKALRVTWTGDHEQTLHTTVPPEAELRWP